MESLRVVVSSNDGHRIQESHLGDTPVFQVFELLCDGTWRFVESRENTALDMDHSSGEKMKKVLGIVADVHLLVSARNSPNFKRMASKTRFQPVVVKTCDVQKALDELCKHFGGLCSRVQARLDGERESGVLQLDSGAVASRA